MDTSRLGYTPVIAHVFNVNQATCLARNATRDKPGMILAEPCANSGITTVAIDNQTPVCFAPPPGGNVRSSGRCHSPHGVEHSRGAAAGWAAAAGPI
jgi:hypothetical protein